LGDCIGQFFVWEIKQAPPPSWFFFAKNTCVVNLSKQFYRIHLHLQQVFSRQEQLTKDEDVHLMILKKDKAPQSL
jgi:hypothetical protein